MNPHPAEILNIPRDIFSVSFAHKSPNTSMTECMSTHRHTYVHSYTHTRARMRAHARTRTHISVPGDSFAFPEEITPLLSYTNSTKGSASTPISSSSFPVSRDDLSHIQSSAPLPPPPPEASLLSSLIGSFPLSSNSTQVLLISKR